jgi:hypothetical protein
MRKSTVRKICELISEKKGYALKANGSGTASGESEAYDIVHEVDGMSDALKVVERDMARIRRECRMTLAHAADVKDKEPVTYSDIEYHIAKILAMAEGAGRRAP